MLNTDFWRHIFIVAAIHPDFTNEMKMCEKQQQQQQQNSSTEQWKIKKIKWHKIRQETCDKSSPCLRNYLN